MGISIDLYVYDYPKLLTVAEKYGVKDLALFKNILEACGTNYSGMYVLLNNELWEDENPHNALFKLMENAFGEETTDKVLWGRGEDDCSLGFGINGVECDEIADKLNIELKEEEY